MNYIQFLYNLFPTKLFKEDRDEYILALRQSQDEDSNQSFLAFMAGQLRKSLSLEIERFDASQKKGFSFMFWVRSTLRMLLGEMQYLKYFDYLFFVYAKGFLWFSRMIIKFYTLFKRLFYYQSFVITITTRYLLQSWTRCSVSGSSLQVESLRS